MASKHNVNICMQQKIILLSQGLKLHVKSRAPRLANFTKTCCVVWGDAMIINKYPDNLADHTEDDNTFESPIHNFSFIDIIGHLISLNIYHYSYFTIEKWRQLLLSCSEYSNLFHFVSNETNLKMDDIPLMFLLIIPFVNS